MKSYVSTLLVASLFAVAGCGSSPDGGGELTVGGTGAEGTIDSRDDDVGSFGTTQTTAKGDEYTVSLTAGMAYTIGVNAETNNGASTNGIDWVIQVQSPMPTTAGHYYYRDGYGTGTSECVLLTGDEINATGVWKIRVLSYRGIPDASATTISNYKVKVASGTTCPTFP